ncbi:MAG: carbohydrate-binding domain-containing protein, partial [Sphaerochaetaceae bacterium]|nr:carbohydrate-binding domain-containing protein [Sphaerochaetaceae bacterium]
MKRKFTLVLIILLAVVSGLWAQSTKETVTEVTVTEVTTTENTVTVTEVTVPVSMITSTFSAELTSGESDKFSAAFNEDGNYEVTYKGTEKAVIKVSGLLEGTLIVKSENADYTIVLDGADIRGVNLPAIQLKSSTVCTMVLANESINFVSDSSSNEKKGVITGSSDLSIEGDGTLYVSVFKKHGIKLDGGLTVNGANVVIVGDEEAEGNMISADVYFVMNSGSLIIRANGCVYGEEGKGIKVNGVEGQNRACGYVEINDGYIDIISVGKAITAGWETEEDATTTDTSDDPYAAVYINGGTVNIVTTGIPYEVSEDESLSPEGIEGKDEVIINGGTVILNCTDDSINAGTLVQFNGGYVYACSSLNDTVDSNAKLEINGGTVIILNSSMMEQGIDCDNDSNFTYTGGTYVAVGNGNNIPQGSGTSAYTLAVGGYNFTEGVELAVLDENSNVVTGFVVPEGISFNTIVFGSEKFEAKKTYTVAVGTYTGAVTDNGLVVSCEGFKASSSLVSFTTSSYTSSNGQIGMNIGGQAGGFP